jgi:hypothetical protein
VPMYLEANKRIPAYTNKDKQAVNFRAYFIIVCTCIIIVGVVSLIYWHVSCSVLDL